MQTNGTEQEAAVLTDEALREFEALWQSDHPGQTLPLTELTEMALRMLNAVKLVYRPIPAEKASLLNQL